MAVLEMPLRTKCDAPLAAGQIVTLGRVAASDRGDVFLSGRTVAVSSEVACRRAGVEHHAFFGRNGWRPNRARTRAGGCSHVAAPLAAFGAAGGARSLPAP